MIELFEGIHEIIVPLLSVIDLPAQKKEKKVQKNTDDVINTFLKNMGW